MEYNKKYKCNNWKKDKLAKYLKMPLYNNKTIIMEYKIDSIYRVIKIIDQIIKILIIIIIIIEYQYQV